MKTHFKQINSEYLVAASLSQNKSWKNTRKVVLKGKMPTVLVTTIQDDL